MTRSGRRAVLAVRTSTQYQWRWLAALGTARCAEHGAPARPDIAGTPMLCGGTALLRCGPHGLTPAVAAQSPSLPELGTSRRVPPVATRQRSCEAMSVDGLAGRLEHTSSVAWSTGGYAAHRASCNQGRGGGGGLAPTRPPGPGEDKEEREDGRHHSLRW